MSPHTDAKKKKKRSLGGKTEHFLYILFPNVLSHCPCLKCVIVWGTHRLDHYDTGAHTRPRLLFWLQLTRSCVTIVFIYFVALKLASRTFNNLSQALSNYFPHPYTYISIYKFCIFDKTDTRLDGTFESPFESSHALLKTNKSTSRHP